jgi:hypothetical protein
MADLEILMVVKEAEARTAYEEALCKVGVAYEEAMAKDLRKLARF